VFVFVKLIFLDFARRQSRLAKGFGGRILQSLKSYPQTLLPQATRSEDPNFIALK